MQVTQQDILRYMDLLVREGICLSVHYRADVISLLPPDSISFLYPYNRHPLPYCTQIKTDGFSRCIAHNHRMIDRCKTENPVISICHADMLEYHRGFFLRQNVAGIITVSGWRAPNPNLPKNTETQELYNLLSPAPTDFTDLDTRILPLSLMLTAYLEQLPVDSSSNSAGVEYHRLLLYLNENHTTVSLDELCTLFHCSRSHLSHLFQKKTGCSLHAYCNRLRVRDAEQLLASTSLSVTEIAQMLGFSDASYFVRVFRLQTGITPLQFRLEKSRLSTP